MNKKEYKEVCKLTLDIYSGILFNNLEFEKGKDNKINYNFSCEEFTLLKEKYHLEEIGGRGSEFKKGKRLLHYFASRLTHSSWYDNHIPCNSLDLLEYSLNNPEQGINCLNKSKILEECCLALGIYSRRVCIMPYSPYDFDNHVVVEIYDRKMDKWLMLDPTSDGYFVDENKTPLSLLEIREKFAKNEFVTYVRSIDSLKDLKKLKEKYVDANSYICKNLFYFNIDQDSTFGYSGNDLVFVPKNYSIKEKMIANTKYRINNLPKEYEDFIPELKEKLLKLEDYIEDERTNIEEMIKRPY